MPQGVFYYGCSVAKFENPLDVYCVPSLVIHKASTSDSDSTNAIPVSNGIQNSAVDKASP